MDRKEYNQCMVKFISGSKPKEQRKKDFCIGAKICSKGISREEADRICSMPKPVGEEKPKKGRSKKFNPGDLASCILENLGPELTLATLSGTIAHCQGASKPYGKKQFLRDCIKKEAVTGSMAETGRLVKQCERQWKENNPDVSEG